MRCPHCAVAIEPERQVGGIGGSWDRYWSYVFSTCPACKNIIVMLVCGSTNAAATGPTPSYLRIHEAFVAYPRRSSDRPACPACVTNEIREDYSEACEVLPVSPKASAALSRRCLQAVLREKAGIKNGDLSSEIQQVLDSRTLPSHLAESIDAVRNIGNFAAHPIKSQASGCVMPVEAGEAEWTLDVLELLFDFYYVQPEMAATRKAVLNAKLHEAGKPPMK